jgi:hypothetical protein
MTKVPKTDGIESDQLVELLVQKNAELQKTLDTGLCLVSGMWLP